MDLQKRRQLRTQMVDAFSLNDLQDLCFELGIEYDNIGGNTLRNKTGELIEECMRRDLLLQLLNLCAEHRPHIEWPTLTNEATTPPAIAGQPTSISTATRHVLLDEYHASGLLSGRLRYNLEKEGFTFTVMEAEADIAQLTPPAIYVLWFTCNEEGYYPFTPSEIKAIRDFIHAGGAALIVGQGWEWVEEEEDNMANYPLNHIVKDMGVFFADAYTEYAHAEAEEGELILFFQPFMAQHPITNGINKIGAYEAYPSSLIVEAPAIPLIWGSDNMEDSDGVNNPVITAATQWGQGKIICMQEAKYLIYIDEDYDNKQLLHNIFNWLAT